MSEIGKYKIEIFTDQTYQIGSADNLNKYDFTDMKQFPWLK